MVPRVGEEVAMKGCEGHPRCSLCARCERYGEQCTEMVHPIVEYDTDFGWTCNEYVKQTSEAATPVVERDDGQLEIF